MYQDFLAIFKQQYSINTQAVVGINLIFTDGVTDFSGSIHVSRVLRHLLLYKKSSGNQILADPVDVSNGASITPLFLEDGGYLLSQQLLLSLQCYSNISRKKKILNKCLSLSRVSFDRAFRLLEAM